MIELVRLEKALDLFLARGSRGKLAYYRKERLARAYRPKFMRETNEFFVIYIKEVQDAINEPWTTADDIIKRVDWDRMQITLGMLFKPVMLEALGKMGTEFERSFRKFDLINERAVKFAEKRSSALITDITEPTRDSIRWTIKTGLKEGKSIGTINRTLRPLVGLNAPQAKAFEAYRLELEAEGLDELAVWGKLSRYGNHLLIYRAETIARTETAASLAQGQCEAFRQNEIAEADWVSDPEACTDCLAMVADNPYKVADIEGLLPLHPRCECTWVARE